MKIKNLRTVNWRKKKFRQSQVGKELRRLAALLVKKLKQKNLFIASLESCTGGAFINALTNIPGASGITKGAAIVYSVQEKIAQGIPRAVIKKYSVYSPEVAVLMAKRITKIIKGTDLGVGITGTFIRPDLTDPDFVPARIDMSVFFSVKGKGNKILSKRFLFPLGKRVFLKKLAVCEALKLCLKIL